MEGYKLRLKVEYSQLNNRINNLENRIKNPLIKPEDNLMEEQLGHMLEYRRILIERCKREGVELA